MNDVGSGLLESFYDLADFDERRRHEAVATLIDEWESRAGYSMERLLAGLGSARAAARLGYVSALSVVLSTHAEQWPVAELLKLADQKLPLNQTTEDRGSVLGQHMLHLAMVNSGAYIGDFAEIVRRELLLMDKQSGLAFASIDLLAQLANKLKRKQFAKYFWPLVREKATKPLDHLAPEWFFFILLVFEHHTDALKTEVSFISSNGKLCFLEADCDKIVNILKKTNACAVQNLLFKLLILSRSSGNFDTVYRKIIEKWMYHGDAHKALSRSLHFISKSLQQIDFQTNELLLIFSREFVHLIRSVRKNNEFRLLRDAAEAVLLQLIEMLEAKEWNESDISALLSNFDEVDGGNFDEFFGGKLKTTEKIMARLGSFADEIVSKAIKTGGWRLRRIASTFPHWPANIQENVLKIFCRNKDWPEETRNAFCSCIVSTCFVNVRAGKHVTVRYKAEHENILKEFVKKNDVRIELPAFNDKQVLFYSGDRFFTTINLSDEDIMHEKENSSSDDEDGGESSEAEQPEQNIPNKENNDSDILEQHEETDGSEFDEDEEEEEYEETDEEFTNNLKKVLGRAAATSDDNDSDKVSF
ncbi:unnamed protein product [Gongylonema pulchrum]|uniref:Ubiquitinyl hydrolase 1 n=1 Tax=Gongylonema pulchrum TaxID=637853 RepID=A0A183E0E0_9BILA|nr:unnamed protein product [Gongylonema pulchrum]